VRYGIFDPTGNITALVESPVAVEVQPRVAKDIMSRHPEVEQVGFVTLSDAAGARRTSLRMAGGEFCGNATICCAALQAIRNQAAIGSVTPLEIEVSGNEGPVDVVVERMAEACFSARVRMPAASSVESVQLSFGDHTGQVALVRMEGISHLIIDEDCPLHALMDEREEAEAAARAFCAVLSAEALGLMFLTHAGGQARLTPLVFVPAADTLFWESSCASGTTAAAIAQAHGTHAASDLAFEEPGGRLRVACDEDGQAWLFGTARPVAFF